MSMLDPSYLRSIRDGILNGNIEANNTEALPDGLVGLYDKELFPPTMKWKERKDTLGFFLVFALAQKGISADFAAAILGDDWNDTSDPERSKEEKRLQRVNELIQLHSKRFSVAVNGQYRLYHERFRLYILQKSTEEDITGLNASFIALCEGQLKSNSTIDISEKELYALECISTHYYLSAMQGETECFNKNHWAALRKYACDQHFWERQIKASKGFEWTKRMHNEMMAWATKFNQEDDVIECALNKVDLYHQEQNDAPRIVQLVADGNVDTALERIEKFGGDDKEGLQRKFILYMLCLMELTILDSKEKDHAKASIEKILKHFDEHIAANQPNLINWNDFFPSYLIFLMACEWMQMELDYLVVYRRTTYWDNEWIYVKGPYNDLQLEVFMECASVIKDDFWGIVDAKLGKDVLIKNISIAMIKEGKIEEALNTIEKITYEKVKIQAFKIIPNELVELGMTKNALKFISLIIDQGKKVPLLTSIAIKMAKSGKIKDAIECVGKIRNDHFKDLTKMTISIEMVKLNKLRLALYFYNLIEDEKTKQKTLKNLSIKLAEIDNFNLSIEYSVELTIQGEIKEALEYASKLENYKNKNIVLKEIVTELIKKGRFEEALESAKIINDVYLICEIFKIISGKLAILGLREEAKNVIYNALNYARTIPDRKLKSGVLDMIACEMVNQGIYEEAMSVIQEELENSWDFNYQTDNKIRIKELSTKIALMGRIEDATFILLKSLETQSNLEDYFHKNYTLKDLSIELAKNRMKKEAIKCIQFILDKDLKINALKNIAIKFTEQGMIPEAIDCVQYINIKSIQCGILKEISIELVNQGNFDESALIIIEAIKEARSISDASEKSRVLSAISRELVNQGKIDNAFEIARSISDASEKSRVLSAISTELAKQGKAKKAAILLNAAYDCTKSISNSHVKSKVLMDLSTEFLKQGRYKDSDAAINESIESAKLITDESNKNMIIKDIALELIKHENMVKSFECAQSISDYFLNIKTLIEISNAQYKLGKVEEAKSIITEAIESLKIQNIIRSIFIETEPPELDYKINNYKALMEISIELVNQGNIDESAMIIKEAIKEAKSISDDREKSVALGTISSELAKHGEIDDAYEVARSIIDDREKSRAHATISGELAAQGKIDDAYECAQSITDKFFKENAMKVIAMVLASLNKWSLCEKTIMEISQTSNRQDFLNKIIKIESEEISWQEQLQLVNRFQIKEVRLLYLKGLVEKIKHIELNSNCMHQVLPLLSNDPASTETILQKHAEYAVFHGDFCKEKLDRFIRTLNLQWAIDIKNQLSN